MARRYGDRVAFIGVPGRDDTGPMEAFVEEFGLGSFPHAVDENGSLWAMFGVSYQPAWAFVSAEGDVEVVPTALGREELERRLDGLLS